MIGIGHGYYPGKLRNSLALESLRITTAIPALVVLPDSLSDTGGKAPMPEQDVISELGVFFSVL